MNLQVAGLSLGVDSLSHEGPLLVHAIGFRPARHGLVRKKDGEKFDVPSMLVASDGVTSIICSSKVGFLTEVNFVCGMLVELVNPCLRNTKDSIKNEFKDYGNPFMLECDGFNPSSVTPSVSAIPFDTLLAPALQCYSPYLTLGVSAVVRVTQHRPPTESVPSTSTPVAVTGPISARSLFSGNRGVAAKKSNTWNIEVKDADNFHIVLSIPDHLGVKEPFPCGFLLGNFQCSGAQG